jgi:FAD/FMN-containing dehydrogenase
MARQRGARLRAALNGRVITPDDAGYDEARSVFYGGIDRRPALIVRVADATDVSRVVGLARDGGLELAVRSGGHSGAGHSTTDGGIVLALSQMKNLEIDTEGRTALAQTGLTAGEYTTAAGAHGLATGFGATRPSFARTLAGLLDGSRGCGPAGSVAVNLGIVDSMQERQRRDK